MPLLLSVVLLFLCMRQIPSALIGCKACLSCSVA